MSKQVHTYCRICEPACGLLAEVAGEGADAEVVRILPDREHPGTGGFACHKGLKFSEVHTDPSRLNAPLKRISAAGELPAQFSEIGWDHALEGIGARLQAIRERHGGSAIAGFMGNPTAFNSSAAQAVPGFFKKLGARFFSSATQDCSNKFAASEAVYGTANLHPTPDLDHSDYFLCLGENPRVSHMSFISLADPVQALRGIVARGGRVLHVNPRRTESVTPATGDWLPIRPDTDLYLLAALIHEIDRLGRFDNEVLARHGRRVEELRAFVARYPAERVAAVTGIAAEDIRRIADDFSAATAASLHMSTGVNMGRQGTLCYWLLQMLSLVTGNLGRRGGNVYSPGFFPSAGFGRAKVQGDAARIDWFDGPQGPLREITGTLPGNLLADFIEQDENPIRALVIVAGNPLLSVGGEARLRAAFPKLELLVVLDLYRNASGEYADYLLPMADWLEREDINSLGLGLQPRPWVQLAPAVVAPKFQRRQEWWVLARLEQLMGLPSLLDSDNPDPLAGTDKLLAASGLSLEQLRGEPGGCTALPPAAPEVLYSKGVQLPDGRIDCCPPVFAEAMARAEDLFVELAAEPQNQLKLINLRTHYMHNSWLHNVERLKRAQQRDNPLHMAPADAEARGLADGDALVVENTNGSIEARVRIDASLRTGVVAMSHGWGNAHTPGMPVAQRHPGSNVNRLLPSGIDSYEKLSNQAVMTGIAVSLRAAD